VTRLFASDYGDSTSGYYHLAGTLIGLDVPSYPIVGTYSNGVAFAASDLGSPPLSTSCPDGLHLWIATAATVTFTSVTPCGSSGWTPGAIAVHGTLTAVATPWSYTGCALGTGQVTISASF
jgi:hypothetical protein